MRRMLAIWAVCLGALGCGASSGDGGSTRPDAAVATPDAAVVMDASPEADAPAPDTAVPTPDAAAVSTPDAAVAPDAAPAPACVLAPDDTDPDFTPEIGCETDYVAVAAPPLVAGLPGVLSAKTVIDRLDENHLYFQNSRRYPIHWDFASTHLSGNGLPLVAPLRQFNEAEYYTPDRRFVLGALNYYEGPDVWAYEIAPYDTADAAMIELAFTLIRQHLYVGDRLFFHPTSDNVSREAAHLPPTVPIVTTDQLYADTIYQPLNLATAVGQLRFFTQAELDQQALSYRDIAVLEAAPNDLSVCVGTITDTFQTPLSHINVLAQNRRTPNMGLRGAFTDPTLRALEGRWVSLTVGREDFTVTEVTREEADAWWDAHRPAEVAVPRADLTVTDIRAVEDILDVDGLSLRDALARAIPAFGGKASHFSGFPHIVNPSIPYPHAVVVPIYYYDQFMRQNGFYDRVDAMLADPAFIDSPQVRAAQLERLRLDMQAAPVDPAFVTMLTDRLTAEFPGMRLKFRSSTNCEDLDGFTGAGLYESAVGDPNNADRSYLYAIRKVWSSVWRPHAFEERAYRSISHREVGMAVLIHASFPAEDAQGVAITANLFDPQGVEPGHYVNVQKGDVSVVLPPDGVTSDQFIYHGDLPGQPIQYLAHSSLVPAGESVLTRAQVIVLAQALDAIHAFFAPVYGPNVPGHFYAMDVEFKFNASQLVIKQARPYPGRGE